MEMPEFTPRLQKISQYRYKIKFLEDGYPGKDLGHTVTPHPIYGIYVIRDYLFQYNKTQDIKYQQAAMKVADASINRMEPFNDSLVFWYKKDSHFNSTKKEYYSGLTQAYYAEVLAKLYASTKIDKYKIAAQKVYLSLKIPVKEGGVFHQSSKGPSIQEYPMNPNGYVLNGWLSAISSIKYFADILQDDEAANFWRENLNTICRLLPLYDAPHFYNSRYTLNGSTTIRITSTKSNLELKEVKLHIPGEEETIKLFVDSHNSYLNYIEASSIVQKGNQIFTKGHSALIKLLLSRYSFPKENELTLSISSNQEGSMKISFLQPTYTPQKILRSNKYIFLEEVPLKKGANLVTIKIPWQPLDALANPTTFKQFGSNWHNVYHFIHINRLEEFYNVTKDKELLKYINKWKEYVEKWKEHPLYKGLEYKPYKET